jgi:Beta/Gamma crystallin
MATVYLWEHAGFSGNRLTLTGDDPFLGDDFLRWDGLIPTTWHDEASSIEVIDGTARFYRDAFYQGPSVDLGPGRYDVADLVQHGIPDNWVSSVDFPPFSSGGIWPFS